MKIHITRGSLALLIAGTALCASASTPDDIDDLVGVRASTGETQLENRGYVHVETHPGTDRTWAY